MKKVVLVLFLSLIPLSVSAGTDDKVLQVFTCSDDVGLQMQNAGWVVAQETVIGEKRVDRILSVGLALLSTGKPTGYFDEGAPISWCGISEVKPITALGIKQ